MQNESGRSLVEMLGTLAIMGILSMTGIAAFHSAMNKHKVNTLIQEAQKRAVVASAQIILHDQKPSLAEFDSSNATEMGRFGAVTQEGLMNQFGIQISYMDRPICQALLNAIGDKTPIRRLSYPNTPMVPLTECDEVGEYLIIYNDDLSPEDKAVSTTEPEPEPAQECETDRDCKTVCGTCQKESNEEPGVCVNECELPPNSCTYDADCNTQNQCLVCDLTTHSCKDGCTRVEFLESTGTQYIDTGISGSTTLKIQCIAEQTNTSDGAVFGCGTNSGSYDRIQGYWSMQRPSIRMDGTVYDSSSAPSSKQKITFVLDLQNKKGYINGVEYISNYTGSVSDRAIWFFGRNVGGTLANIDKSSSKIYQFKIWDNGVLVRDFIPVLDWNMTPCMFDKVSGVLFCNQGTGKFLYKN